MAGLTLVQFRSQLVTKLKARAGLSGVEVTYGFPGDQRSAKESIWCGFAEADSEITAMRAGTKRREERYSQDVVVEVVGDGQSQEDCDIRAAALMTEVENALAEDPTIGLATIAWAVLSGWRQVGGFTDKGTGCRFEASIEVVARLL